MKVISNREVETHKRQVSQTKTVRISELFHELVENFKKNPNSIFGQPTSMWSVFNATFGGARPGELITITADTGVGKTTFLLNWFLDYGRRGYPSMLMSFENTKRSIAFQIAQMINGKGYDKLSAAEIGATGAVLGGLHLWFLNWSGAMTDEGVLDVMDYGARKLGIKVFFIDHLDYIKKNWSGRNESYVIGDFLRDLAGKAKDLDVTVVLVAHPTKLNQPGVKRREVGLDELKGSSSIKQESDAVFALHRPDPEKPTMQLRYLKIRDPKYGRNTYGKIRFQYNPNSLVYSELSTGLEWGND